MKCSVAFLLLSLALYASADELTIAGFNLRILGPSKIEKSAEMDTLTDIIIRYDLCLLQEIKDSSGTAVQQLLDQCNSKVSSSNRYELIVGPRVGSSSQSTEQYAYIYKTRYFAPLMYYSYNDNNNWFSRDPFICQFEVIDSDYTFAMIGLHTPPEEVYEELQRLDDVQRQVSSDLNEPNIVMLGDFNADTPNLSNTLQEQTTLFTSSAYNSLIDSNVDTTTSHSANDPTAYDRIVITDAFNDKVVPNSAGAFDFEAAYGLDFDFAYEVSDHYPVYVNIDATPGGVSWNELYSENFNSAPGSEWDHTQTTTSNGHTFLGQFGGGDAVKLTIDDSDLPSLTSTKNNEYRLTFTFHAIGSWNGKAPAGPDTFKIQYYRGSGYSTLYEGVFCNASPDSTERQSYPTDEAPTQQNRCGTGSSIGDLGYSQYYTYQMTYRFTYNYDDPLVIRWSSKCLSSSGYEPISQESWGLDNVYVEWSKTQK